MTLNKGLWTTGISYTKNGQLLELLGADPPMSVNHGRPPGANAAELDRGFSLLLDNVIYMNTRGTCMSLNNGDNFDKFEVQRLGFKQKHCSGKCQVPKQKEKS